MADDYPNNTSTTGNLSVGGSVTGQIDNLVTVSDTDWFRISLVEGTTYVFDLSGVDGGGGTLVDPVVSIYGSSGQFAFLKSNDDSGPGHDARLVYIAEYTGDYYLDARAFDMLNQFGTYRLSATSVVDDYAAEAFTNGDISIGGTRTGEIQFAGDYDWFEVTLTAGTTYEFRLNGQSTGDGTLADPYLEILNASGEWLSFDDEAGDGSNAWLTFTPETTGTYYLTASSWDETSLGTYQITAGLSSKPSWTDQQAVDSLTRLDAAWSSNTVTFSFFSAAPGSAEGYEVPVGGGAFEPTGFTPFSAEQMAAAREALALWDELIDVDFVDLGTGIGGDIRFGNTTTGPASAWGYYPGDGTGGDIWINPDSPDNAAVSPGDYGFTTLLHEIGHALGLAHPSDFDDSLPAYYSSDADYIQDTLQYTVMSYFDAHYATDHYADNFDLYGYAATPLLHDIQAIQSIYGPDLTTRTGNTVYGRDSSAGHLSYDFSVDGIFAPVAVIWDAGGYDVLDVSWSGTLGLYDAVINLQNGTFSSFNGMTNNLAIAPAVTVGGEIVNLIERAVGSSGSDLIIGNIGDNWIDGGAGDDTLIGGAGNDYLNGETGSDTVDYSGTVAVTVSLALTVGQDTGYGRDQLASIENVIAGSGNDQLIGNSAANNLFGGAGDDTLQGGAGNNALDGGIGADTAIFADTLASVIQWAWLSAESARLTFSGSPQRTDTITSVETLQFSDETIAFADVVAANDAPIVTVANLSPDVTVTSYAASQLFSAVDPEGNSFAAYRFLDATDGASSGHFTLFGVEVAANTVTEIAAADLNGFRFVIGNGATVDSLSIQVSDGLEWSEWASFTVTAPLPAPEITVLGNAVSIADGDTTPSTADHTSFGSASQGGVGVVRTFTARNDGTVSLSLSDLVVPTGFTVVEGLSASLAPGTSDTFQVRLETGSVGVKSGQVNFTTNDSDESPFSFDITGTVLAVPVPEITVLGNAVSIADGDTTAASADHTDFGTATQGGAGVVRTFTVRNDGNATLNLSALNAPTGFTVVEGVSSSLAAGASDTFQVRLDTGSLGTKTGQISFTTNDGDENPFNFTIAGTVVANVAPVASASNLTPASSAPIAAASLFSVTDANGDAMTKYQLWDHTGAATSGKFYVNGVAQPIQQNIDVTPAQLAQTVFQPGTSGSDLLYVRAFDGALWSDWADFTVAAAPPTPVPEITVLGNAVSIADGDTTPASADHTDFGSATQGGSAVVRTFTVRNDGTATLTLDTPDLPTGFTLVEGLSASLAPGASDTFQVRLDTTTVGTKSGQISIANNDGNESPFNFSITGTVAAAQSTAPEVTVLGNSVNIADGDTTPASADHTDFGSATQGGSAVVRTFTVRNDGDATLTLGTPTLPTGFTLVEGLSASLAAGATDTFQVRLDTGVVGTKSGQISFTNNDGNESPFNFAISGTVASAPQVNVRPVVSASNVTPVDSGPIAAASLFSVSDANGDTMTKYQLWDHTGAATSGKFYVNGVAQGVQVNIDVTAAQLAQTVFQPGTSGSDLLYVRAFDGALWSDWDDFYVSAAPAQTAPEITVLGNGASIADGDTTPAGADHTDFGSATEGGSAVVRTFTVRNDGNATLTLGTPSLPTGFTLVEGLSASLAAGASDTFQVRLDAASQGTKSGQISFTSNDGNENPFNFSITGTVVAPQAAAPEIAVLGNAANIADGDTTPSSADHTDFGSATQGGAAVVRTFTVRNDGTDTLTLGTPTVPTGFTLVEPLVSSLAPGATDTFQVRLDTGTAGAKSGQISIDTNDASEDPFNFTISGTVATPPQQNVAPVVSASNITAPNSQPIAAASLFSVNDANGDAITIYQLWDHTFAATSGRFYVNGVAQPHQQNIDVTPAQLAQTVFQPGTSGSDLLYVRVFDGALWSDWEDWTVAAPQPAQAAGRSFDEDDILDHGGGQGGYADTSDFI